MERWPPWISLVLIIIFTLSQDGEAQSDFTFERVTLTLLPGSSVASGTDVTLRCEAKVLHSSSRLIHSFSFLLNEKVIYSKNSSEAVVERRLPSARASNSGNYKCFVQISQKSMTSRAQTLTVTGMQTPQMKVRPDVVYEGEEFWVSCSAPEETASLQFHIFINNTESRIIPDTSNSVTVNMKMDEPGVNHIHCYYRYMLHTSGVISNNSNTVTVTVREISIKPTITIWPKDVVEGDRVSIQCSVSGYNKFSSDLEIFLTKSSLLFHSRTPFTHNFDAKAEDSGDYVCKAEKGNVQKSSTAKLLVAELFSRPVLSVSPKQMFEGETFRLSCSSTVSLKRITDKDVKYKLYKEQSLQSSGHTYNITASKAKNGNYTCVAEAKKISKTSKPLTINAKVPVSTPVIQTVGEVIIRQPFQVVCESSQGTLPITYTLLSSRKTVDRITVTGPLRSAMFNISSIVHKEEIQSLTCEAQNPGTRYSQKSEALNTAVIEPVSRPELTLSTKSYTVTEGMDVIFYCNVQGTVPITFTWYHSESSQPLYTTRLPKTQAAYTIKSISRDQRGHYYCEASNDANVVKRSSDVPIGVNLAGWKKAVIAVICILILVLIVTILVLFLKKAKAPRRRKRAVELSVKSARPKSSDPMRMSLTLDIEDNTALNATPVVMGRNVWSEHASDSESDDSSREDECEKLQHTEEDPQQNQPSQEVVPINENTETVTADVEECTQGDVDEEVSDQSAVEYVQMNHCEKDAE